MKSLQIAICGSFGFGNAGDEAVPRSIERIARAAGYNVQMFVLSRWNETPAPHVIDLSDKDRLKEAKSKVRLVLATGGGIIEPGADCVLFKCKDYFKRSFGGGAKLFSVATEPGLPYSMATKIRIKWLLKNIHVAYVRDVFSEEAFRTIVPSVDVETIGDVVIWLADHDSPFTDNICSDRERFVGVNVTNLWAQNEDWVVWIARELVRISEELDLSVKFIPMSPHYGEDNICAARITSRMREISKFVKLEDQFEGVSPESVCRAIGECALMISMRLHGCVMAFSQNVPFVGIGYHPKIYGFAETVGWRHCVVPATPPRLQTKGWYGYNSSQLAFEPNSLCATARRALRMPPSQVLIDELKDRQVRAFRRLVER